MVLNDSIFSLKAHCTASQPLTYDPVLYRTRPLDGDYEKSGLGCDLVGGGDVVRPSSGV